MNKLIKVLIAIIGAIEIVFSIFIPISIVLMLLLLFDLSSLNGFFLIIFGISSSIYRAIRVFLMEE